MARSTFPSQNAQNTPWSDHFWKLRCRKSARRCGAKHISKSKCTKHRGSDHFWKLRCRKSARRCGAKHISESKCTLHRHRPQIEKVGTDGSQRGNQRLPWQGTAGSQTLKLRVPNLGTRGYHCKELLVPRGWNSCFPTWEP